jgi:protein SCO1/2
MRKAGWFKKTIILVIVLALPGFLYYLLVTEGKNRYHSLRIMGPKPLAKTTHRVGGKDVPDTLYHSLPDFKLTDQDGKQVSLKNFYHKIFVADFFYTNCPGICRQMNENINELAANYAKSQMVYFVSITVDPARDSVPVLKAYSKTFKPLSPKWLFLTGDTSVIYNLARNGFLVNAVQTSKNDFIYEDKLILIDQDKRIRGVYTGNSTRDIDKLNDEIKVLKTEEIIKNDTPAY